MSRAPSLSPVIALRTKREERARATMAQAGARLREAAAAVSEAEAAIESHDRETDRRERDFLDALRIRPLPGAEFARSRDVVHGGDPAREALTLQRNEAVATLRESEDRLAAERRTWIGRLAERDRLAELSGHLRRADHRRSEALAEAEAAEAGAKRGAGQC